MQGRCRGDAGEIGGTDLRGGSGAFGRDAHHGFAQHQQPLLGPPGPRGVARVPESIAQEGWRGVGPLGGPRVCGASKRVWHSAYAACCAGRGEEVLHLGLVELLSQQRKQAREAG